MSLHRPAEVIIADSRISLFWLLDVGGGHISKLDWDTRSADKDKTSLSSFNVFWSKNDHQILRQRNSVIWSLISKYQNQFLSILKIEDILRKRNWYINVLFRVFKRYQKAIFDFIEFKVENSLKHWFYAKLRIWNLEISKFKNGKNFLSFET